MMENDEEDCFDPADPNRLLGPSSTCAPEFNFVDQGKTDEPFSESNIGDASDGPGLQGATGAGTWVESKLSLGGFRGRQIRIRFLQTGIEHAFLTWEEVFYFNPDPLDDGWFVDDVTVTDTLTQPAVIEVDSKDNTDLKGDWDLDSFAATCDCAPVDETAWNVPGETTDLVLSHSGGVTGLSTLEWLPPSVGGTVFTYDTLSSLSPSAFDSTAATTCIQIDGSITTSTDANTPAPDSVHFFLIRARHSCGDGPLGTNSSGQSRTGIDCI